MKKSRHGKTLRDFFGDVHAEIGTKKMGFDPSNMTDNDLLHAIFIQGPKLKILCSIIKKVVYGMGMKMVCWIEYPWEQIFLQLILTFIGVDAQAMNTEVGQNKREDFFRRFTKNPNQCHVFILTYKVGGVGLKSAFLMLSLSRVIQDLMPKP